MANVLSKPDYQAAKGYQGFPLRNSIHFSSALGHLLPVWWHSLDPGDKVDISSILKTRTNPLDAPAMVSINEHLDWFFVPYRNLFKLFEQYFYGVDDVHSSIFPNLTNVLDQTYPCTDLSDIVRLLVENNTKLDDFGYNYNAGAIRLLQALGYDISSALDWNLPAIDNFSIMDVARSLWSICAYQAIYFSHYRLSDRQSNNPKAYNLDNFYDVSQLISYKMLSRDMFMLRYRPIQKDFFHGGFVSPLIGPSNIGMLNNFNDSSSWFGSSYFRNYLSSNQYSQISDASGNSTLTSPSDIKPRVGAGDVVNPSLSGIRQSFALEKLLEITRRAGKHIDEQTLAHFGVKMPEGISDEPIFIGSNDSEIQIGDVISTAGTDSDPLGELAGKGYNNSNGYIGNFEAKCHGILMCIYSSDIPLHYRSDMCDRLNTMVSPSDFYHPEFDDLGMQPIFQFQGKSDYDQNVPTENNTIKDWTYRYWEQKIKYNRVFGSLESTPDESDNLSHWTVSRYGFDYNGANTLSNYLVNPNFTDSISLMNFYSQIYFKPVPGQGGATESYVYSSGPSSPDANWRTLIFGSDLFIHDLFVDVKVASKKSVYGLPSL